MSPTVLRVERYRFLFVSNEGHEPPHVHLQDGEQLAKRWLDEVQLAASSGFVAIGPGGQDAGLWGSSFQIGRAHV